MKILLTILALAVNGICQVSGQGDPCQFANNFHSYSLCQSGQIECNSVGCSSNNVQCPYGSSYSNGQCLVSSSSVQCLTGSTYNNGVCINNSPAPCPAGFPTCNDFSSSCQQPNCPTPTCLQNQVLYGDRCFPNTVVTCPLNSSPTNGICYPNQMCDASNNFCSQGTTVTNCPQGYTMSNGSCIPVNITCTGDSFPLNGQCAMCPPNSIYIDGACSTCAPGTTRSINGTCECPTETVWSNGRCVSEGSSCGQDESLINGICMKCYDGECCKSTFCNDCFLYCDQYNTSPNSNSSCRTSCIKNEIPFGPESSARSINEKGSDTIYTNLANFTNIINITNIVNSTNIQNVITNVNNTNINNIRLGSNSNSENTRTISEDRNEDPKQCCIIIEAHTCSERTDKKWECKERRRHVCGAQCFYDDYTPEVPLEVEQEPIIEQYPVYIPVAQFYRQPPTDISPPPVQVMVQPQPTYEIVQQGCQVQEQWPFVSCANNYENDCQQCVSTGMACPTFCQ